MKKGDIVLGKDLKPGMLVGGHFGLVINIDLEGDDHFWDGEPNIHLFDVNDPYYGPCSTTLDPEKEFKIAVSNNSEQYRKIINDIRKSLEEGVKDRLENLNTLNEITRTHYEDVK